METAYDAGVRLLAREYLRARVETRLRTDLPDWRRAEMIEELRSAFHRNYARERKAVRDQERADRAVGQVPRSPTPSENLSGE